MPKTHTTLLQVLRCSRSFSITPAAGAKHPNQLVDPSISPPLLPEPNSPAVSQPTYVYLYYGPATVLDTKDALGTRQTGAVLPELMLLVGKRSKEPTNAWDTLSEEWEPRRMERSALGPVHWTLFPKELMFGLPPEC